MNLSSICRDNLGELIDVKGDIKKSIERFNIIVDVGMKDYDDKIRAIEVLPVLPDRTKFGGSTFFTAPKIYTSNMTDMSYMFYRCEILNSVPPFDTSNVTDMNHMFYGCANLRTIPPFDTSNVTNMSGMFMGCHMLGNTLQDEIPELDTSNVTDMNGMFADCYRLTYIPELDTSNVTNMYRMFYGCNSLISIPQLDTSNVIDMSTTFNGCESLISIPKLNCTNVQSMAYSFSNCFNLTDLGGFEDLKTKLDLKDSEKLTKESISNVINNLGVVNSQELRLPESKLNELAVEEIAIATNKGWTITT